MKEKALKHAVGYVRTAIKDQSGEALDRQEKLIQQYCEENKLLLLSTFKDNGASGAHFIRPGWKELLDFIKQNKGIVNSVIVGDLSRIGRNYSLYAVEEQNLKENHGITIQAADYSHKKTPNELFKNLGGRKDRTRKKP